MQNSPNANSASATELRTEYSRAKISGARTKVFLIHCLGRASRSSEYADDLEIEPAPLPDWPIVAET